MTDAQPRRCTAHNRQGKPCGRAPIAGGSVCHFHGGAAPQVKNAARARLAALVDPAIRRLGGLMRQNRDPKVALGAVKDILDRNNLVGKTVVEHSGEVQVTRIERVIVDPKASDA